jgi:hypothetical protein
MKTFDEECQSHFQSNWFQGRNAPTRREHPHTRSQSWKPPFRVDVTDVVKSGRNTLEIRVANRWPNRMIGDAALPASGRFTWSSFEPFTKDTPLPKSGLLGPMTIQTAEIITVP